MVEIYRANDVEISGNQLSLTSRCFHVDLSVIVVPLLQKEVVSLTSTKQASQNSASKYIY